MNHFILAMRRDPSFAKLFPKNPPQEGRRSLSPYRRRAFAAAVGAAAARTSVLAGASR